MHARSEACLCVKMVASDSGFYMRSLPSPPAINFTSPQGKQLFTESLQNGTMEGFFKLISHFLTQSEPAYCGLASLAMVLNSLSIDPCRKWKGPWRWFDETMLDFCEPLDKVKAQGISFGKVICLAHCAGANVEAFRTNQSSIDEFRKFVVVACSSSEGCHLISSYDRSVLGQTGVGHFSPIGGYHCKSDMVLILDVARFKYPPHWVPLSTLWRAMDTIDEASRRGFMLVSRQQRPSSSSLQTTNCCIDESWIIIVKYLKSDAPLLLSSCKVKEVKDVISTIFSSLPLYLVELIKNVAAIHRKEDGSKFSVYDPEVMKLVRDTSLYKHVARCTRLESVQRASSEDLTELLLALPHETWTALKDDRVFKEISSLVSIEYLPSLLQDEVLHIRGQLLVLKRCHYDTKNDPISTTCA